MHSLFLHINNAMFQAVIIINFQVEALLHTKLRNPIKIYLYFNLYLQQNFTLLIFNHLIFKKLKFINLSFLKIQKTEFNLQFVYFCVFKIFLNFEYN